MVQTHTHTHTLTHTHIYQVHILSMMPEDKLLWHFISGAKQPKTTRAGLSGHAHQLCAFLLCVQTGDCDVNQFVQFMLKPLCSQAFTTTLEVFCIFSPWITLVLSFGMPVCLAWRSSFVLLLQLAYGHNTWVLFINGTSRSANFYKHRFVSCCHSVSYPWCNFI